MVLRDSHIRRILCFLKEMHCIAFKKNKKQTIFMQLFAYKKAVLSMWLKLFSNTINEFFVSMINIRKTVRTVKSLLL